MLKELYVRARSSKRPTRLHAPSWRLTSQHLSMKDSHPKFAFWYLQHKNTVSDEGSWEKDGRSTVRTWERGEKRLYGRFQARDCYIQRNSALCGLNFLARRGNSLLQPKAERAYNEARQGLYGMALLSERRENDQQVLTQSISHKFARLMRISTSDMVGTRREDAQKETKIQECQIGGASFPSLQMRREKIWSFQFLARSFLALSTGKPWKRNSTNSVPEA